jgi:VIT1/CCC1 family predicted Fe2+/Mn2+ transporter
VLPEREKMSEDFSLELYKSLRGEIVGYIEKVPAIWLQKFTLVGAVIAFLVINYENLGSVAQGNPRDLLGAAMVAIPILAALLDAKAIEYSLHARAVSRFIQKSFESPAVVAAWEATLWGDLGSREIRRIVRLRSWMTGVVTSAPTILLMVLAAIALDKLYDGIPIRYIVALISLFVVYAVGGIYIWRVIWPKKEKQ